MRSTFRDKFKGAVPPYLGGDLTDRYAIGCRPIDVCGLTPDENGQLKASFWTWEWDAAPNMLDVTAIVKELAATRAAMLDGPQGLAAVGHTLRDCERKAAAVGKTPDTRPQNRPFAGFICSSLDLFTALKNHKVEISTEKFLGGVSEVYPGHIWQILAGRVLPKKSSDDGRLARRQILDHIGVSDLPKLPTHDQNDACIAAVLAAAADKKFPNEITVQGIGNNLTEDPDGTLREGLMVIPVVSPEMRKSISKAFFLNTPVINVTTSNRGAQGDTPKSRAENLFNSFIIQALKGNPQVCTYSKAYRSIFNHNYKKWAQAYTTKVLNIAEKTSLRELPGLGAVRLDAFIVAKGSGLPSNGHWESAMYDCEDWERVLGMAELLH